MTEPSSIETLGRALFAQLSPLCGQRGTGTVAVTSTATDALLRNAYLVPVVGGVLRPDLPFKVAANPATLAPDGTGGGWAFDGAESLDVAIVSNTGGAQHNLPADTVFRFDPPLDNFAPTATLGDAITDASSDASLIKRLVFFEDLAGSAPEQDIWKALAMTLPGGLLVWESSEPAEGRSTGLRKGGTRAGRAIVFFRETFALYVATSDLSSDHKRRQQGLTILEACTVMLTDKLQNRDGEQLSQVGGGVEITSRARLRRGETLYIYALRMRVNRSQQAIDERTFARWEATRMKLDLPGREAPEPITRLTVVDATDPMP